MISTTLIAFTLAAGGLAQSNRIARLYLPADSTANLHAEVIGVNSTATAYVVGCPTYSIPPGATAKAKRDDDDDDDEDDDEATATATASAAATTVTATDASNDEDSDDDSFTECGFPTPVTVTQGPSTLSFAYQIPGLSQTVRCKLTGTTRAVCTGTMNGESVTESGVTTATLTGTNFPQAIRVPITEGAEKLNKSTSAGGSSTSSTASSAPPSNTQTEPASGTSAAPAATTSAGEAIQPLARKVVVLVAGFVAAALLFL